jgi:hypothetical protein
MPRSEIKINIYRQRFVKEFDDEDRTKDIMCAYSSKSMPTIKLMSIAFDFRWTIRSNLSMSPSVETLVTIIVYFSQYLVGIDIPS